MSIIVNCLIVAVTAFGVFNDAKPYTIQALGNNWSKYHRGIYGRLYGNGMDSQEIVLALPRNELFINEKKDQRPVADQGDLESVEESEVRDEDSMPRKEWLRFARYYPTEKSPTHAPTIDRPMHPTKDSETVSKYPTVNKKSFATKNYNSVNYPWY